MAEIKWERLVGQDRVKTVIGAAYRNGTLGHAYLFCGERGTGKMAAALDIAAALLCQSQDAARPCGECPACVKVKSYSHPDFHIIMPLVLDAAHKSSGGELTDEGWDFVAGAAKARIDDPYRIPAPDGIPLIPVDWIREANQAIRRGATEGAFNVVVIDGVDTMKKESANTMLKTLEEPPPGTVMILLTDKAHSVLQTIVSRCQLIRFALLPPDVIAGWLAGRFGVKSDDPRVALAASGGSIGAAIYEFEDSGEGYRSDAAALWDACMSGDFDDCAEIAESLSNSDNALDDCRQTLRALLRLLRFAFFDKFHTPINYISLGVSDHIELPEDIMPRDVERFVKLCQDALSALEARGNCMMVMVNFVCTLMEMLNAEKQ